MKKLIIGTITSIALLTGVTAIAKTDSGPNSSMIKMFVQYHDMTDHQQELMTDLFLSGKSLVKQVKEPKEQIRTYLSDIVERDEIDVEQIMASYEAWQDEVNEKFEETLIAAAKLHSQLSVEQRRKIVETIKDMKSRHGKSFYKMKHTGE